MTLIDSFKSTCVLLEKSRESDGEGGWIPTWTDGLEFEAAITDKDSTLSRIAEQQGVTSLYTVTTDKNVSLDFHDAFRRKSDGKGFRITKVLEPSPDVATFEFNQYQAEEWEPTA